MTSTRTGTASVPGLLLAVPSTSTLFSDQTTQVVFSNPTSSDLVPALSTSDALTLTFFLDSTPDEILAGGTAAPSTPARLNTSRNDDFSEVTLSWESYEAVSEYEIERTEAIRVEAGGSTSLQYGNLERFTVTGTVEGVDSYQDATVSATTTYRYRIRAQGNPTITDPWSDWSPYAISGEKARLDLDPPSNVRLSRAQDNSEVAVSWTAPIGEFDSYTVQRQELVILASSTIFANIATLGGDSWLPASSTTYTDSSILPNRTYEYRVAAVKDDVVGTYTEWARASPFVTNLGDPPGGYKKVSSKDNILDDRREFWLEWDEVGGVDDYEVEVLVYQVATGGQTMERYFVTDPTYFRTSYGRVEIRVRGRKQDSDLCGSGTDDRCHTEWTSWNNVRFSPRVRIEAPEIADDTADASIMNLRKTTEELLEEMLGAAGADVSGAAVIQFVVVTLAVGVGGLSVALAWRRGMAPLGVGMGIAILILILFTGYRLYGVPLAWGVAAQSVVGVAGLFALVRQTGVFR